MVTIWCRLHALLGTATVTSRYLRPVSGFVAVMRYIEPWVPRAFGHRFRTATPEALATAVIDSGTMCPW